MKRLFIGSFALVCSISFAQTSATNVPKTAPQEKPAATVSKPLALMGGTIETADRIITSGVILTDGTKITYVGTGENIRIGNVTKIDCTGMYIYAGFCDPFVTRGLNFPEAKENEVRDVTTTAPASMRAHHRKVTRPDVKAADFIDMKFVAEPYQSVGYTHVALAPSAGVIRGQMPVVQCLKSETKNILLKEIASQVASISGGGGFGSYPGSTFASMAVFRQTMNDAQTYPMNADVGLKEINEALAPVLAGTTGITWVADNYRDIYRSLMLSQEYGIKPTIATAREAYRLIPMLKELQANLIISPAIGKEPTETTYSQPLPKAVLDFEKATWAKGAMNIIEIQKAGIPFAITAQGGTMNEMYDGLRWLVSKGLDRKEVLKAMTLYPAQILGIDDQLGSLESGKMANITILSADFLDKSTKVKGLVIAGKYVEVKL